MPDPRLLLSVAAAIVINVTILFSLLCHLTSNSSSLLNLFSNKSQKDKTIERLTFSHPCCGIMMRVWVGQD